MPIHPYYPGNPAPGIDQEILAAQKVDLHLSCPDGKTRCSLWWSVVPQLEGQHPGIIGHFEAASCKEGSLILREAAARLHDMGCSVAIGPMDGNTWRRYRVLTERNTEPPFFMEPDNPEWWAQAFTDAGFSPFAKYSSSLVSDLHHQDPRFGRTEKRLHEDGVRIRSLNLDDFDNDLRRIFRLSAVSFTGNFLYTAISEDAFLAQYLPYRGKILPELVLLAERDGETVGYLFAIPDYAEAQRGVPVQTVVGKTLAVLPGKRNGGLGVVLAAKLHEIAAAKGYQRVIHALQHEGNAVRNMSNEAGNVMRRYTLYAKALT